MSEIRKYNLSEVADLVTGSTPRTDNEKFWNGSIPFYSPADFHGSIFCEHTEKTVSEIGAKSGRLIPQGAIMVTCIGTIGKIAISSTSGITNQQINTLLVKTGFDARYVYYVVLNNINKLKQAAPQTTIPILNKTDFGKFRFDFHEFSQQIQISAILSTIDRTITHTEALIEKYQQIKAGLMHDLFTRGIDADGKLRPPRDRAPELYQDSSIGWIPKEWKLEALNYGLSASPKNGYSPKEVDNWQDVYVLGLGCLTRNGFSPTQLKNAPKNSLFSGAKLEDGDFLISRSNTQELVGLCGIYHDIGHDVIYPDLMIKLKFNKNLVGEFLEKYLLSKAARQRISAIAVGTSGSMVKINATTLKALKVIYPKSDEQLEIVEKLEPIENQISCLKIQFDKLKKQKSGLMHDLLTGTVQVNSDPV